MAIAFDSVTATGLFTDTKTQAHTPVGTPRGVLVLIAQGDVTADQISGVTYGGVSMTEVTGSPLVPSSPLETGAVYGYFLGSSIPTGTQDCVITCSANTADKHAAVITYTAVADTAVHITGTIEENTSSDVTANLALSGVTCAVALAAYGTENVPSNIAPLSGWGTDVNTTADYGVQSGVIYSYDTIGSSDVTYGVNDSIAGIYVLAVAIKESAGGSPYTLTADAGSFTLTGQAAPLAAQRKIAADTGSFTLTGNAVTLTHATAGAYTLTADTGSFALTGNAAGLAAARKLAADTGSFTFTGLDAWLTFGRRMAADTGAFVLTGIDVTLTANIARRLTAEAGAFSLTGGAAMFTWSGQAIWAAQTTASGTWADAANTSDIWTPAATAYGTWDNL